MKYRMKESKKFCRFFFIFGRTYVRDGSWAEAALPIVQGVRCIRAQRS